MATLFRLARLGPNIRDPFVEAKRIATLLTKFMRKLPGHRFWVTRDIFANEFKESLKLAQKMGLEDQIVFYEAMIRHCGGSVNDIWFNW